MSVAMHVHAQCMRTPCMRSACMCICACTVHVFVCGTVQQCVELVSRAKKPVMLLGSQATLPPCSVDKLRSAVEVSIFSPLCLTLSTSCRRGINLLPSRRYQSSLLCVWHSQLAGATAGSLCWHNWYLRQLQAFVWGIAFTALDSRHCRSLQRSDPHVSNYCSSDIFSNLTVTVTEKKFLT